MHVMFATVYNLRFDAKVAMESCTRRGIPAWGVGLYASASCVMCDGYNGDSETVLASEYMWINPAIDAILL